MPKTIPFARNPALYADNKRILKDWNERSAAAKKADGKKFTSKLGSVRNGKRIWIEGARLSAHGFYRGALVQRKWEADKLTLITIAKAKFDALPAAERSTVSGKDEKPIIDIVGVKVAEIFPGTHVTVTYRKDRIVIERAA